MLQSVFVDNRLFQIMLEILSEFICDYRCIGTKMILT